MEYYIVGGLVAVALVWLFASVVVSRRGHDPSNSVRDFTRALSALERTDAPRPGAKDGDEPVQAGSHVSTERGTQEPLER